MPAITTAEANKILDGLWGVVNYSNPTAPIKIRLMTVNGSAGSAGTEVTGGSYSSQSVTMGSASGASNANTATVTYTSMPAVTVTGIESWDSAGTPRRLTYAALAASKALGAGDSLSFPVSSVTHALG